MDTAGSHRAARVALLLVVITGMCSSRLFAKTCDQPSVNFKTGQLSVSSNGCSLQQVLDAVKRLTDVKIVAPPSASTAPVFVVIGPGDPAQVISELLEGSSFNYSLATRSDPSGSLVRVVVSDRAAFVPAKLSAAKPGTTGAPDAKKSRTTASANSLPDDQNGQGRRRAPIDEATLKKLPPLPPGVPSSMFQLYPSIVDNGGVAPSGPLTLSNGRPVNTLEASNLNGVQAGVGQPDPATTIRKGVINLPQLPPNIDPAVGKLYPWNLMEMIGTPVQTPPPRPFQYPPWLRRH
jgi:hypothetical protein